MKPEAARLARYADLVRVWAPRLDLVSTTDLDRFEERHIADALRLVPVVDSAPAGPAIDVGSGAGLPGIPLAITVPGRSWRLLEARRRRAAFLEEVVRELELDCEIVTMTAQQAAGDPRYGRIHAIAVARALAPPIEAFRLMEPLVRPGGRVVVVTGESAELPPEAAFIAPGIATMTVMDDEQGISG